uniref:Biotin carboxyl carrier protein of acetyl-CoA carboxylase n=1 Tax=Streptomyces sp. SoC090715LN-16 TaxID=1898658 RepID=A0A3B8G5M6_9ACTN|nr:biotin carboxyl carrier [Streptomyces sp. SoC090715LN-16]
MGEIDAPGESTRVQELSTAVERIVEGLPGTIRRLTVSVGECSVDVTWSNRGARTAAPVAARPASTDVVGSAPALAVTAPLVGAFYSRPTPDAPAFVEIGAVVRPGDQVALIEAMKLFTPVRTELAGRVIAFLVADGDMVEYGQPLLDLEPVEE